MPSLNKAKELSRQVVCQSNLKQIGIALFMYACDCNEYLPPALYVDTGWNYKYGLSKILSDTGSLKYSSSDFHNLSVAKAGVWVCPSDPCRYLGEPVQSYGVNYKNHSSQQVGLPAWNIDDPAGSFALECLSRIERHSEILLIADSQTGPGGCAVKIANPVTCSWGPASDWGQLSWRHSEGGNVCFFDGHVNRVNWEDALANNNDIFGFFSP